MTTRHKPDIPAMAETPRSPPVIGRMISSPAELTPAFVIAPAIVEIDQRRKALGWGYSYLATMAGVCAAQVFYMLTGQRSGKRTDLAPLRDALAKGEEKLAMFGSSRGCH